MYIVVENGGRTVLSYDNIDDAVRGLKASSRNAYLWQVDPTGSIDITNQYRFKSGVLVIHPVKVAFVRRNATTVTVKVIEDYKGYKKGDLYTCNDYDINWD